MKALKKFFDKNDIPLESKFLLAISGGPDSMALLDMMRKSVINFESQLYVAHLDHQLREDSWRESELLQKYCKKYGLTLLEKKWPLKDHPKRGIEASARKYRYNFFKDLMIKKDIPYLLTAHHGDDLTENILLKLIRSGNVEEMNSLQEIGNFNGRKIVRPLLIFSKAELLAYVNNNKINYIQDQTNFEDDTLRNRIRHHIIPLLKKENPQLIKNALTFQRSELDLKNSQSVLFENIKAPSFHLGALAGERSSLKELPFSQQKLYFEWLIFNRWHRRVHFKDWNEKNQKYSRDGITLIFYQGNYYLIENSLLERKAEELKKVYLEKSFIFEDKEYTISLTKNKSYLVGTFYAPGNLTLKAGSIRPGARLELANKKMSKAKKKFAESKIPKELRKFCLTIEDEEQDKIYFVQDCYQNQTYDRNYCKYYVYCNSEEKFK